MVYDADFDVPLAAAQVTVAETGEKVTATDEGNYVFGQVPPGAYTLVFAKDGYTRQVRANVVVSPGQLTEVNVSLSGEFTEMEEFVVQDLKLGGGTEAGLLNLRMDSPALLDSIGADLISRAGVSDAASALTLVSGATVEDGKFAVIRGLPDRFVSTQMNGVRLPTADAEKRAVQLDQFPSDVIESIQVSKTFTPDQQGDASGGAVNLVLKGIPDETLLKFKVGTSFNTQVTGKKDFLTYRGGGVNFLGMDDRDIPSDGDFTGAVGVSRDDAPIDYNFSLTGGGKHEFENGIQFGGLANFFYRRDSSFFNNGIDDSLWVDNVRDPLTPQLEGSDAVSKTSLFDVTQGSEEVKWGGLGTVGLETEDHSLTMLYLFTHTAEEIATLAQDTRGKEFFFPGYDPNDPTHPGNQNRTFAPYLRNETLEYTERTTETIQFKGKHTLPIDEFGVEDVLMFDAPEFDWTVAFSSAELGQPNKRQFSSIWLAESLNPGFPPFIPPFTDPAVHRQNKPAANFTLGNLQRIWREITEDSDQFFFNVKFPFKQWTGDEGYLKFGVFNDDVTRKFNQDSFSNFNDNSAQFEGPFEFFWSSVFPFEDHPVTPADIDVDYNGEQKIFAWYVMADVPLTSFLRVIGGARFESTELNIINDPEADVIWIPPGSSGPVTLNPGDADVFFEQDDILPSITLVLTPIEQVTLRGSYTETVARQTFRELSPIQQQEFLGGDVFIGNPFLKMSALKNYDIRVDYTPYEGGLISFSYFHKDIKDPIEFVQRIAGFVFTTPVNFPEGELSGFEIEVRQDMGHFWDALHGLSVGANATFIDSEVMLPPDEAAGFDQPNIQVPTSSRDMTNAPEHLYNFFLTYDLEHTGTQFGIFYTVRGDTLVAGAGQANGNFVPDVYEKEFGTLNLSVSQKFWENWRLTFQAKNLTNPEIQEVYRSRAIGGDRVKTSRTDGIEFSIGISAEFFF